MAVYLLLALVCTTLPHTVVGYYCYNCHYSAGSGADDMCVTTPQNATAMYCNTANYCNTERTVHLDKPHLIDTLWRGCHGTEMSSGCSLVGQLETCVLDSCNTDYCNTADGTIGLPTMDPDPDTTLVPPEVTTEAPQPPHTGTYDPIPSTPSPPLDGVRVTTSLSQVGILGQEMELECTYTMINPPYELDFLVWNHDDTRMYTFDRSSNQQTVSPEYRNRLMGQAPTNQRSNLTLLRATLPDAGTYTCTIYSTEPNTQKAIGSADITQTDRNTFAQVIATPSEVTSQGQSIVLDCIYQIDPPYKLSILTWFRNEERLYIFERCGQQENINPAYEGRLAWNTPTDHRMTLTLLNATVADAGQYICKVFNTEEFPALWEDGVDLRQMGASIQAYVTASPAYVTSSQQWIDFECKYTGINYPFEMYFLTWSHGTTQMYSYDRLSGQEIVSPDYDQRLLWNEPTNFGMNITIKDAGLWDAGSYICQVYVTYTYPARTEASIDVVQLGERISVKAIASPAALTPGEHIDLECHYWIHPPYELSLLTWHFGDQRIYLYERCQFRQTVEPGYEGRVISQAPTDTKMTLTLLDVTLADVGHYRCEVFNTEDFPAEAKDDVDVSEYVPTTPSIPHNSTTDWWYDAEEQAAQFYCYNCHYDYGGSEDYACVTEPENFGWIWCTDQCYTERQVHTSDPNLIWHFQRACTASVLTEGCNVSNGYEICILDFCRGELCNNATGEIAMVSTEDYPQWTDSRTTSGQLTTPMPTRSSTVPTVPTTVAPSLDGVDVTVTPYKVQILGQDLELDCTYSVIYPPYRLNLLAWEHDNTRMYTFDLSSNQEIVGPEYRDRLVLHTPTNQKSNLTLLSAGLQDAGTYTCTVYSTEPNTEKATGSADVTQTDRNTFAQVIATPSQVTTEGQSIVLECIYQIDPPYKLSILTWLRDEERLYIFKRCGQQENINPAYEGRLDWNTPTDHRMTLTLLNATVADAGQYICKVFNTDEFAAEWEDGVDLRQRGANIQVSVAASPSYVTSRQQPITLECMYTGINSPFELYFLTWSHGTDLMYSYDSLTGEETVSPEYRGRLWFEMPGFDQMNITIDDANLWDAGSYICKVYVTYTYPARSEGSVEVAQFGETITAKVIASPAALTPGEHIDLECHYWIQHPHQLSLLTWHFGDQRIYVYERCHYQQTVEPGYEGRVILQAPTDTKMTLTLLDVTLADVGHYSCEIFNTEDFPAEAKDGVDVIEYVSTTTSSPHITDSTTDWWYDADEQDDEKPEVQEGKEKVEI